MQIITKKLADLIPYAGNARTHSQEQVKRIVASIQEFGWTNPVLIDETGGIIAGHGRVMAAKKMGMEDVPCIVLAGLTEAQRRAYVLADNKLALDAGWDEGLLRLELEGLQELDFDLSLTGFDLKELDLLFKDDWVDPDAAPPVDGTPAVKITITVDELRANELKREVASVCAKYNAKVV